MQRFVLIIVSFTFVGTTNNYPSRGIFEELNEVDSCDRFLNFDVNNNEGIGFG